MGVLHSKGGAFKYSSFAHYLVKSFTSIKLSIYYSDTHFSETSALSTLKILNLSKPTFTPYVRSGSFTDPRGQILYTYIKNQTSCPDLFRYHWALSVFLRHTSHLTSDRFHGTALELNWPVSTFGAFPYCSMLDYRQTLHSLPCLCMPKAKLSWQSRRYESPKYTGGKI